MDDPFELFNLGELALENKDYANALNYFDQALSTRPQFAGCHLRKGQLLLFMNRPLEAVQSFASAWVFSRFTAEPGLMMAQSMSMANFHLEACLIFQKIPIKSFDSISVLHYAESLRRVNRIRDALELRSYLEKINNIDSKKIMSSLLLSMNQLDEAENILVTDLRYSIDTFVCTQFIQLFFAKKLYSELKNIIKFALKEFNSDDYYIAQNIVVDMISDPSFDRGRLHEDIKRGEILEAAEYFYELIKDKKLEITGTSYQAFDYCKNYIADTGLILEFGVRYGHSICHIAEIFPSRDVYGFDSFEGIPDQWGEEAAGSYTTNGMLPDVPENVYLIQGWFKDTIPKFKKNHSGQIAFMNIDCDIYLSTVTILSELSDQIDVGTVIVFDEYICNKTWKEDEFKAFQEWVRDNNVKYKYVLASFITKQVAVIITYKGNLDSGFEHISY